MTGQDYIKRIEKAYLAGNATEHTYRPILKGFIESLADGITATNEPKRIQCGAPDYIITRGETRLGYIEAKDIDEPLDRVEKSEQLKRYLESLSNLILTDYLEFRWYVRGEHRLTAKLASIGTKGKLRVEKDGAQAVTELLGAFFNAEIPTVANPKELATRMAAIARLIRDTIRRAFTDEDKGGSLHQQMEGFRKVLLHDLTEDQFADMYAQTTCYGLFAARCNVKGSERFTREHAAYKLPKTNPFLRKMFSHIAGPDLDDRIVWAVDDLAELLDHTDIAAILQDFGKRTRREDPVVHFYETFLAAYDPKMREARGVYYTPEPVVSYIVRSVDHILKTDFSLPDGLADATRIKLKLPDGKNEIDTHKVLILDPATGTGTFLYEVINHIYESFKNNKGMWSGYVSKHLLPRLFGFELLMAPCAVAHMKLGLQLDELGYDFKADERLQVYLTNTLEEAHEDSKLPLFAQWLAEEANTASTIKQKAPVMVVLGNPPYSGHSANTGQWIANLLRGKDTLTGNKTASYFEVNGEPLGERNPKWLNDDYVKFIRFAQWRIEQTGYGILAFITNHGYFDNPTFRGMRRSLLDTFDDIYVLDLHGNSKKKERSPDGSKDENVFDIQQGVAIGLFIKQGQAKKQLAVVRHTHLWGMREIYEETESGEKMLTAGKYHWLWQNDISTTKWTEIKPQLPFYLFVPQDTDLLPEYNRGWLVTAMFEVYASTVTTARNDFAMAYDEITLVTRIQDLKDQSQTDEALKEKYNLKDVSYWNLHSARNELFKLTNAHDYIKPYCYRPFDFRFVFYHEAICERLRLETMRHMYMDNVAFLTHRPQSPGEFTFAYCTSMIGDQCVAANKTFGGGNSFQFPLYRYPVGERTNLFDNEVTSEAASGPYQNFSLSFIGYFAELLKMDFFSQGKGDLIRIFGPEDVFNYMYATFHSATYRSRYAEFLKMDFPRLPLTSNADLFRALCPLGAELVALHLMKKHAPAITRYPIPGDNMVEAVRYTEPGNSTEQGRVWINKTQYFEGVPPEVWGFHIGGYQVCQKWLKDRKGRKLTYDDLTHYQHIVSALAETVNLMAKIDETIEGHGGWPIQ